MCFYFSSCGGWIILCQLLLRAVSSVLPHILHLWGSATHCFQDLCFRRISNCSEVHLSFQSNLKDGKYVRPGWDYAGGKFRILLKRIASNAVRVSLYYWLADVPVLRRRLSVLRGSLKMSKLVTGHPVVYHRFPTKKKKNLAFSAQNCLFSFFFLS